MPSEHRVSSFIRLSPDETFERDYYIAHTSLKRFPARVITLILLGLVLYIVPGIILLLYFAFKRLKISHGYAAITNERVIYYEFNEHPEENYQSVKTLHLRDITAAEFLIRRTVITRSFNMTFFTEKAGLAVGAKGFIGLFTMFGKTTVLEPGPDALQFMQEMTGTLAARRFLPASASSLKL